MSLKKTLLIVSCLNILFVSACFAASSSAVNMNEGKWEITSKMEMANMPFDMPPMTHTMCMTKEDLIPQQDMQSEENNCKISSQNISNDTVSWSAVCDSAQGKTTSSGTITYKGNSFEGEINMQVPGTGAMNQTMSGRRIGDCD